MLIHKKNSFEIRMYSKIAILLVSFIFFGMIYYLLCDDYEFGGINILQEEIRKYSFTKLIDKVGKGQLDKGILSDISDQIQKGNVDKKLNKKITKEIRNPRIEKVVQKSNKLQKLFDRIYFSVVTGTTLGYGDMYPLSNKVKILIILQLFTTITILLY